MSRENKYLLDINIDEIVNNDKELDNVEDIKDFNNLVAYHNSLRTKSNFLCITIAVTNACNFRCTYCFEDHESTKLELTTIKEICNIIKEYKHE